MPASGAVRSRAELFEYLFLSSYSLDRIKAPTLLLLSTGATFADPHLSRALLRQNASVAVRMIDCQHWPLTERPEEVRQAIDEWIGSHPR